MTELVDNQAFPCPTDTEVWLEYGWRPDQGSDNMLWYNEGNPDEFRHFWLAFMKKLRTDEPRGRMYFKLMIRPVTQEWVIGSEKATYAEMMECNDD